MGESFRKLRPVTLESIAATVMNSMTAGFLTLFALYLGATNAVIGMVVAVPAAIALLGYIPAAMVVERLKNVKRFCSLAALGSRSLWLAVAILPFLPAFLLPYRMGLLIFLVSVSSLAGAFINPGWAALMSDLVPDEVRGRYFAMKNRIASAFSLIAVLGAGFLLDITGSANGFFFLFLIAGVAGILTSVLFAKFPETYQYSFSRGGSIIRELKDALKNRVMRRFLLTMLFWQFSVSLASPFFNVYLVDSLHAPYAWASLLLLASGAGGILMYNFWGRLSDTFGSRQAMIISSAGATFVPILWVFAPSMEFLLIVEFMSGAVWAGLNMANFNYVLEVGKGGKAGIYSALFWTVIGISTVVAPIVGGQLADSVTIPIGAGISGLPATFVVSFLLRSITFILFLKFLLEVQTHEKISTRFVTQEIIQTGVSHLSVPFVVIKDNAGIVTKSIGTFLKAVDKVRNSPVWKELSDSSKKEVSGVEKELRALQKEEAQNVKRVLEKLVESSHRLRSIFPHKRLFKRKRFPF